VRVKNNEAVEVQDYLDIGIASQQLTVYAESMGSDSIDFCFDWIHSYNF